jgi:hypothetical protein
MLKSGTPHDVKQSPRKERTKNEKSEREEPSNHWESCSGPECKDSIFDNACHHDSFSCISEHISFFCSRSPQADLSFDHVGCSTQLLPPAFADLQPVPDQVQDSDLERPAVGRHSESNHHHGPESQATGPAKWDSAVAGARANKATGRVNAAKRYEFITKSSN